MPAPYDDISTSKPVHFRSYSDPDVDEEMESFSKYVTVSESHSRPVTPLPEKVELTIIPRPSSRSGSITDLSNPNLYRQQSLPELCRVTIVPSDQAVRDSRGRIKVRVRKEEFQEYSREIRRWEWEENGGGTEGYDYKPAPLRNKSLKYTGPKPRGGKGTPRERPKSAPPEDIFKRYQAYLQTEKYADDTTTKGMKWKDKEFLFQRYGDGSGKVHVSGLSEGLSECYVSQYKHSFVEKIEKPHIARWMVEMEPKGVEHKKSKLCIMKHRHDHAQERPKSAPPDFLHARMLDDESPDSSDDVFMPIESAPVREEIKKVITTEVEEIEMSWEEREQWRKKGLNKERTESDVTRKLQELITGDDLDSFNDVDSSSYAPSDDDSDSQRSPTSPLHLSKPRLIRLSQQFPGIRTLERQRRRSQKSRSDSYVEEEEVPEEPPKPRRPKPKKPKARKGEYGFALALTANNSVNGEKENERPTREAFARY